MSSAVPQETEQGYTPPTVRQFSVFLDNKVGKLNELLRLFEEQEQLHLAGFSVIDASDYAVVRVIFSNADLARSLLRQANYTFSESDLLVVELQPSHTLKNLCVHLLGAELNIRFAYPVMLQREGCPTVAISVDDHTLAGQILLRKRYNLLGEEDLA